MTAWEYWTLEVQWARRGPEPGGLRRDRRESDWFCEAGGSPLWGLKEILDYWGSVGWELTGLIPLRSGRLSAMADGVITPPPPGPPEGLTLVLKRPRAEAGV